MEYALGLSGTHAQEQVLMHFNPTRQRTHVRLRALAENNEINTLLGSLIDHTERRIEVHSSLGTL